ncbi:M61 family metallopeptidase [Sedimenticola thiotaurini]|uniref:Peptidase M61 n=1 Tax=Sedimenticola thiotaurini TaxID=1543721 RepID=A0A0F7K390_9GAMM|nr:PDZ domain-containing protein [Sedimenticola thiotaurini]AKH21398.1 peptidase M61 [Sedimenticola thiotaurini]
MIDYVIKPLSPETHQFQVNITIHRPDPAGQVVSLPAWIPGSYMIRDFAKNIVSISAFAGEKRLDLVKLDKQTWKLPEIDGPVSLRYLVYAWDLSVRGAHLDTTHGFFNGTSVFLRVHGQEDQVCQVDITAPDGNQYAHWRVATTLPSRGAEPYGFGRYRAGNYEELIDHPVEMGEFSHASFEVAGVPHDLVITGKHYADLERICTDLKKICGQHISMFGELPRMDRYLFLVTALGDGYGGLEHRSSTSLICKRDDLPQTGMTEINEGYRQFLGLCSHEYFHLWNVKRIRPLKLMQSDLTRETHTTLLWFFEGVTSYYDDLGLLRSGRIDENSYLELLARSLSRVYRGTGRFKQSVAESSFDAWTKFYKQDENAPNAVVSYYTKGALVALVLDLLIRTETAGRLTLDQVMRALWLRYGRQDIGLGEQEIEQFIEEFTGIDLKTFFDQAVRGYDDLDLADYLDQVGVGFQLREARGALDQGGVRDVSRDKTPATAPRLVLGVATRTDGKDVVVTHVFDQGAAQLAGISAGDVLVAIDGLRVSEANMDNTINCASKGEPLEVVVFRRDELMRFDVTPLPASANICELWLKEGVDEQTLKRRHEWLNGLPGNV